MRGALTPLIQQIAKERLGIELTTTELRLLPYLQYVMLNGQRLDPWKINQEERQILQRWKEKEWIAGGAGGLSMSKDFYDAISEIIWEGYVIGGATEAWVAVKSKKDEPMFTEEPTSREPGRHEHKFRCIVYRCGVKLDRDAP